MGDGDPADGRGRVANDDAFAETAEELYESAPVAYISSLPDGTIVRVNETLLRWTGHTREALLGRRLQDLLPTGARIYYETHYAPLLQMQGQVREVAVELARADGTRLPVLMNSVLVRDADGAARVVRTTAFDASERRRYERELLHARADAEARARAAEALANIADGVLLVGEDGRVELLNAAAEAILEARAAAVVGHAADQAIEGWATVAARVAVGRPDERPAPEIIPVVRGGREQWLAVSAGPAAGAVVYTLRDVTAERNLDQERADMVAVVSHELRTPLTGVYGASRTLLARYDTLDDAQRRMFTEMIADQSTRMTKILDQIVLTSRLDSGAAELDREVFDARDVVDMVLQAVENGARHRVVVDAPAGLAVRGDLDQLRQVVLNLVDNALKYSDGPVTVRVEARELAIRFTVADEGPGIPAPDRERIFEKFVRLDPGQRSGVGGTGLGLYIARELARRMGGRLGLLPRPQGAMFFVDVPRAD